MTQPNNFHFEHPQPQSTAPAKGQIASSQPVPQSQPPVRINLNTDIIGLFQTVSVAPTQIPNSPYQQIQLYVNGATYRLYVYDGVNGVWHYASLT